MDKYKYTYEKTADYCYKGTNVLINNLNITNDEDLFCLTEHIELFADINALHPFYKQNGNRYHSNLYGHLYGQLL